MQTSPSAGLRGTAILTFAAVLIALPYLALGIVALGTVQPVLLLILAGAAVTGAFAVMRIGTFSRLALSDVSLAAALVLLPPGVAALLGALARLSVAIRERHDLQRAARSAGASAISLGTAGAAYHLLNDIDPATPGVAAAICAGMIVVLLDQAQLALLVLLLRRRRWHGPERDWWLTVAGSRATLVVPTAASAAYANVDPWVLPAAAPFIALVALVLRARFDAERRVRILDASTTLARAVGTVLDPLEVFRITYRQVSAAMDTDGFYVALVDRPRDMLRYRYLVDRGHDLEPFERPLEGTLAGLAIARNAPLLMHDSVAERERLGLGPAGRSTFGGAEDRSLIVVPLRLQDEVVGVLCVQSVRPAAYDDSDLELLEHLAFATVSGIERADVYTRSAGLSRRLVDLHAVGMELSAYRELGPLAQALAGSVVGVIGASGASVYLEMGEGRLDFAAGTSGDIPRVATLHRASLPGGLHLDPTKALEVPDTAFLPADARSIIEATGRHALVAQPLRAVDESVGVLFAVWDQPHVLAPEERELIGALAGIGGSAIRSVRLYRELDDAYVSTVTALTATIEARDHYREDHQRRVAADALALGERLGLSEAMLRDLRYAALFHSLGKIGVPPSILGKPGPLTPEERDLVREHPLLGARVLESIPFLRGVVPIVRHANERWDGTGYPAGLRDNDIPYPARILQIAISFEAMVADRPYRAALPPEAALAELRLLGGVWYDPVLVIEFVRMQEARGAIHAVEVHVDATTRELSVLAQITPEFHNLLDVQQLIDRILVILGRSLPGSSLTILLEEEGTGDLVARAAGGARRDLAGPTRMAPGRGLSGAVMRTREPVLVDDVRADPRYVGDPQIRSELVVPLISNGRAIGVLVVSHPVIGAFSPRDLALLQTVCAQIAAAIDVASLHERLKRAANTDALTGIHNYGYFYQRLEEEVARAERRGTPLSVAFFDIDDLKVVNDTHGHTAGNEVLRMLGKTIEARVRTEDVPARYGGDEFAIVMPDTPREEAEKVVQRLMELLDRMDVALEGGAQLRMPSRSWGVAAYPLDGRTARELIDNADTRAYARKRSRV